MIDKVLNNRFADFHANRHLFITSLERAGISPKMAQTLARHSDIRLTLDVYTHVGRQDQCLAVAALPAPPAVGNGRSCRFCNTRSANKKLQVLGS